MSDLPALQSQIWQLSCLSGGIACTGAPKGTSCTGTPTARTSSRGLSGLRHADPGDGRQTRRRERSQACTSGPSTSRKNARPAGRAGSPRGPRGCTGSQGGSGRLLKGPSFSSQSPDIVFEGSEHAIGGLGEQAGSQEARQAGIQAARQSASQPARQAGSQPASQPASQAPAGSRKGNFIIWNPELRLDTADKDWQNNTH